MEGTMRKLILMLLLGVVSSNAIAEWVLVTAGNKQSSFVDSSTIQRLGEIVRFFGIDVFIKPQMTPEGKTFMSVQSEFEVDCSQQQSRRLNIIAYSGKMGSGDVIYVKQNAGPWRPANRSTVMDDISKYVCGKQ